MFCGQCGKRVLETMLFCPFCGATIVIPEQGELEETAGGERAPSPTPAPESEHIDREGKKTPASIFDAEPEEALVSPRSEMDPSTSEDVHAADAQRPGSEEQESVELPGHEESRAPVSAFAGETGEPPKLRKARAEARRARAERSPWEARSESGARQSVAPRVRQPDQLLRPNEPRTKSSFVPVRDVDVNDIFMDGAHPGGDDPYDGGDRFGRGTFKDDSFDFEEPENDSFFQRHIRGMVGLILLLMVLVLFLIWAALPNGQRALATLNLAWSASVYNELGHEAYEAKQFEQAATCFERALVRDGDNYEYAHSAMVAYYDAGNDEKAFELLKRCIEMDPDNPAPYHELLVLFPDPAARPWEASELIRLGYTRTGDESLNISSE